MESWPSHVMYSSALTGHPDLDCGAEARVQLYDCAVSDSMVFKIRMSRCPELNFTYLRLYYLDQPRLTID